MPNNIDRVGHSLELSIKYLTQTICLTIKKLAYNKSPGVRVRKDTGTTGTWWPTTSTAVVNVSLRMQKLIDTNNWHMVANIIDRVSNRLPPHAKANRHQQLVHDAQ
ncbi:hypothetical protein BJ508DRAFT_336979 [Ascobolus immersus RN42]|uniref:Uncharacterized protein n=1 Tax=Ascobolus immersus RN42 TaxID=1160509 RepID=A0A3N4H6R3_ASCIM|nr:hypothetical protein BJ508DRAFT_336979 [Ascobolus immersus RN42]